MRSRRHPANPLERIGAPPMRAILRRPPWLVSLGVAAAVLPLFLSPAATGVATNMLIAALFALAFNLLIGQGGMLSFGHAAYFAIGAFGTVHAMTAVERGTLWLPTPLLPLAGALAGLITGVVAGYFATLRSGVYFSMVTLAIAELFHTLAPNMKEAFGGESGLTSMRQPWLGLDFGSESEVYGLVLAWVLIAGLGLYLYTRTPFGRLTVALRENERRIAFLGFDPHLSKVLVFAVSATFAGLAGGLLAVVNESANYMQFGLGYSASVVLHTFIGGSTVFLGPALGAAALTLFGYVTSDLTRMWLLYQGLLFVAVMAVMPDGVGGFIVAQARLAGSHPPSRLIAAYGFAAASFICLVGAVVFTCEMLGNMLSRDYLAQTARLGGMQPIALFGRAWLPAAAGTWAVPLAAIAAGLVLARAARGRGVAFGPKPERSP